VRERVRERVIIAAEMESVNKFLGPRTTSLQSDTDSTAREKIARRTDTHTRYHQITCTPSPRLQAL
jgi:hypothetical protein